MTTTNPNTKAGPIARGPKISNAKDNSNMWPFTAAEHREYQAIKPNRGVWITDEQREDLRAEINLAILGYKNQDVQVDFMWSTKARERGFADFCVAFALPDRRRVLLFRVTVSDWMPRTKLEGGFISLWTATKGEDLDKVKLIPHTAWLDGTQQVFGRDPRRKR